MMQKKKSKIEELTINKTYNEETISYIIEKNENCKAIYTKEIDAFKWGKEKVKLIQIINGYENNDKKETTYLILEPQNKK